MRPIVCALLLLPAAGSLVAQMPAPGARVRVISLPDSGVLARGSLLRVQADTVVIEHGLAAPDHVLLGPTNLLQVSYRTGKHTGRGALIGMVAGTTFGALVGAATYHDPCAGSTQFCFDLGGSYSAMGGAVIGGLLGAVLGAAIGSHSGSEHWRAAGTGVAYHF